MLGDIGHDIKNMLMPVLTGAQLLQDEVAELFDRVRALGETQIEDRRTVATELLNMITGNTQRIHDRVREIADAVKGVTSPPQFAPCQVAKVVSDVMNTLRQYASQKGVTLETEGLEALPVIQADEHRLFNAFYNLINNAIPEVPAGGSVTVRGQRDTQGNTLHLLVADTGRGMPPEVRDSLFTPNVVSRKPGGTGLGTKIVKDVIDVHGGTIRVESEQGRGTVFHIALPITRPQ
jgi:signal transduction histidine kinase